MKNRDVIRFLQSFAIILICIYLADLVIGKMMAYLYKKQTSGLLYRSTYSLDSTRADILVLGSSRANHHYDPAVFEEKLNSSFYNCGRDAQGLIYSCALAAGIIHRYHPRSIIIDIRPNEFTENDEGKLSALLPYRDNPWVRPFIKYNGSIEDIKCLSHIYPYNSLFSSLLVGISSFNRQRTQDFEGYLPLKGSSVNPILQHVGEKSSKPNLNQVSCFKNLLTLLDSSKIPALIVLSPMHGIFTDGITVNLATELCSNYQHIKFLNYSHDSICTESRYFSDDSHLNEIGAKLFSAELIAPLKSVMRPAGMVTSK